MNDNEAEDLARLLRSRLEPEPEQLARVVARARAGGPVARPRGRLRLALAAVGLAAFVVPWLRPPARPVPRITNVGDLVLVRTARGHSIVGGFAPEAGRHALVLRHPGEMP